jgi:Glycosyl transferases group 1/Glycosyltransferase Family 4
MPRKRKVVIDGMIFELQLAGGISRIWSELIEEFCRQGREFEYIEHKQTANKNLYRKSMLTNLKSYKFTKFPAKIRMFFKWVSKDEVLLHTYFGLVFGPGKCVMVCHDLMKEMEGKGIFGWIFRLYKLYIYRKIDFIICISNKTQKELIDFGGQELVKKIMVIYNPVNLDKIKKLGNVNSHYLKTNSMIYYGNRNGFKNFEESFRLLKLDSSLNLKCIGKAPDANELERIAILGLSNRIQFIEYPSDTLMYNEILRCLFIFFPSIDEGFGLPLVESAALGVPIMCRSNQVNREIGCENAFFYDPAIDESMIRCVQEIRDHQKNYSVHAQSKKINKFDLQLIARQYWEKISEL